MKKIITLFLVVCLGMISGCGASEDANMDNNISTFFGEIEEAQQIEIVLSNSDISPKIIDCEEDIKQFIENLNIDTWELANLPDNLEQSATIAFKRNETVKLGQNGEDLNVADVGKLCTYRSNSYVTFMVAGLSFDFKVSENTAEYLNTMLK